MIHDDEADTSEATVRALLADQCPDWVDRPLRALGGGPGTGGHSGTDNALWRLGDDLVVRLPRISGAAGGLTTELAVLPALAGTPLADLVAVPTVRHAGHPAAGYPWRWAVLGWLDGVDAWSARHTVDHDDPGLAVDLARLVRAIGAVEGLPVPTRRDGDRGGSIGPLLAGLDRWLDDPVWSAPDLVDVAAVRRLADQARELADDPLDPADRRLVHGDLLPGNLLVRHGRPSAVIDWGGAALADPAQDLTPAWSVLDRRGRAVFREALEVDDATWLRGRAFELQHAVGAVLYYRPRRHPLADVMTRTLDRVLRG